MGNSVNENVECSCIQSNEAKENTPPLVYNEKAPPNRTFCSLVLSFAAFVCHLPVFVFLVLLDILGNIIFFQGRKRYKDPKTARVFVMDDASSCDKLLQCYRSNYPFKMDYIGIDCEWVTKKGRENVPVALLQIATPLCDCFLVRLCKMDGQVPQTVKEILEDKTVLKFGVNIQNDAQRLSEMSDIHAQGCVDLRHIIPQRTHSENGKQLSFQKMSLDALANKILGVTLDKSKTIQCSNWEEERLSAQQIEYAMNDALVASHIFLKLVKEKAKRSIEVDDLCAGEKKINFTDVWNEDKDTKQSSSITSQSHPDSNKTGLTLKQSAENLELCLTGQEAAVCNNKNHDSPKPDESKNLNQEGKYQGKINDKNTKITCERSAVKGACDLCPDAQICDKPFQDLANGADYYETTIDLSKFESEEKEGYLLRDEVINLISHPNFTQRAGSLCQGVIDMAFKARKRKFVSNDKENNYCFSPEKSCKPSKSGATRKSPLYKRCMLTAPDGSRLRSLDCKKANWYLKTGKGHLTSLDPYTVQLNFEPAGRPGTEDNYYQSFKQNICVVCGGDESYMRKNVVPHDYRRHFPPEMKGYHSHDILLTCPKCHSLSNRFDDQLRKELAIKYNAPLESGTLSRLVEDPKLRKVKSAAKALSHAGTKIPEGRRQELSLIVQEHFSASALIPEMILQAATMETHKENADFVPHGFQVVKRVCAEGKILEFEKMWRKHFVDTMRPKFLPPFWSVDHRHEILKVF